MTKKHWYRGKSKETNEWVYGYFVQYGDECYIFEQTEVNKGIDFGGYLDCCCMTEVIPETIGEFINLTDKNGTEIFEGDLVGHSYGWSSRASIYQVEWRNESCGFEPFSDSCENCGHCGGGLRNKDSVVIGNVHDNPELLEKLSTR